MKVLKIETLMKNNYNNYPITYGEINMEFFDVIEQRYSMRGFEDKEVEQEKLDKILKAAQLAPTGVNFQPFKVIVIDTKKYKEELKGIYSPDWFTQAPIVLCVVASKEKALGNSRATMGASLISAGITERTATSKCLSASFIF